MVSSNRRVFACILFLLATASFTHAQKDQTATISGKVTLKNKGAPGIVVVATENDYTGNWQRSRNRATTDEDGNYRINNVPTGNYLIYPVAPALVVESGQATQKLAVTAGETVRDINFAMVQGGVITGKVTDANGQPLIEESVSITPLDPEADYQRPNFNGVQTDDRGVYRAFGLRRGKYKVSVGASGAILPGYARKIFKQIFYPSVTDPAKATILEVNESSEIKDIDIVTSTPSTTFTLTGRIIEGETGKPIPNVMLGVSSNDGDVSVSSSGAIRTNGDGEFKLDSATPGKYTIFAVPVANSDWRADPLTVDVVDKDLTGLEIKTRKAGSLAGVVVLKSSDNKAKLNDLFVFASFTTPSAQYEMPMYPVQISGDGSFKLGGLAAGNFRLHVRERSLFQMRPWETISVELNGVPQPGGIDLKDGEQVAGLRIVVRPLKLTGAIRGQIKFENGEPPPASRIVVSANRLDEDSSKSRSMEFSPSPEVDSRGHFLIERLEAGTYELSVRVLPPGGYVADNGTTQQVTVSENAVTEVTVIVKLKP
jgi:protocatechuate 3,4-dioxygenase beta subunit